MLNSNLTWCMQCHGGIFLNPKSERLNGKIQEVKSRARGCRIFKNFRSAILFFNEGLNLHPLNLH